VPRVIAICNAKGGVGKTTLTAALAVGATGKVVVVDADPQGSLEAWFERRDDTDIEYVHATDERGLTRAVAKLRSSSADWVLIDGAPALIEQLEAAIVASDFVVIPVRPSIFDIEPVTIAIELCQEYGRAYALLVNAADKDWKNTDETTKALRELGDVLPVTVRYHEGHAASATEGQSAAEFLKGRSKSAATKEIDALWDAIKARLPKGRRA
jgi:chromosome partitioning protein